MIYLAGPKAHSMAHKQTGKVRAGLFVPLCLAMAAPFAWIQGGRPAPEATEPIAPLAGAQASDPARAALGESLFNDPRLSHGDRLACSSCHRLDLGGDDGQARSVAQDGGRLDFNAPTVFNAALDFRLNWRGNFRSFEEQNEAALLDRRLMNTSWEEVLAKLRSDPGYSERFAKLYGAAPARTDVLDALAVFQRSLITPDARFDRYLKGERNAITSDEEEGYRLFKAYGCVACHQGVNIGGNLFQKFGIFQDPFAGQKTVTAADLGRFAITGVEADRHVFRVPSLRNVAVTAPYFHDGRTASLGEAVRIMARNQLGRELDPHDANLIVEFLGTLTGRYRGRPLTSTADRPRQ
ncbi:cytochrome-c peroxidase [Mesorhizobium captivum]|uniref:cytochrome-c peroxidase n=1 Tax=Mesorhizobium captivum TaxID=3072319 RepID=UPI002A24DE1D|nr:cytochrome c peroxidase [Mesorhizobium sp. VK3C]MDX8450364.1 cytochrome c peroxidase [Mesorhizobium sp. VK3C]